jgi:hypothetical protein
MQVSMFFCSSELLYVHGSEFDAGSTAVATGLITPAERCSHRSKARTRAVCNSSPHTSDSYVSSAAAAVSCNGVNQQASSGGSCFNYCRAVSTAQCQPPKRASYPSLCQQAGASLCALQSFSR